MAITVTPVMLDGITPGWEQSGDVTVRATYPFKINLIGMVVYSRHAAEPHDRTRRVANAAHPQMTLCSGRGAASAKRSTESGETSTNG